MPREQYSREEIAQRGHEIYRRDIRDNVMPQHKGKFLILDIESGDYEMDTDDMSAEETLQAQADGNTAWFKGEVEGKRNFNQGNRSPYYQLLLNAWEHIFIFRKPGASTLHCSFPSVLATKPVIKMKGGKNVLGHTAPFPASIPDLLLSQLAAGATVLDPFSGSMTTGRAAYKRNINSTSVELHLNYCELGINLLRAENGLPILYASAPPFGGPFDEPSE